MTAMTPTAAPSVVLLEGNFDWFKFWERKERIALARTFESGGVNLHDAGGNPGIFALVPRYDTLKRLVGFNVVSDGTKLPIEWNGVSLAPMGKYALGTAGAPLLPKFDGTIGTKTLYNNVLKGLVGSLHDEKTDIQRLEGYFPVFDDTTNMFNIDRVRIVNVPGLVQDSHGPQDLSLIVLTLIAGTDQRQNGGGNGPPEP